MTRKSIILVLLLALIVLAFPGCEKKKEESETKIVLTTGFRKDEIFRIEKKNCSVSEAMVYLINMRNRYENIFGSEIWKASYEGNTLEENIKETVLARIAQIKTMDLMAEKQQITLTESELKNAKDAGTKYYRSLNQQEIDTMQVTEALLQSMYEEYALANKVYHELIADIDLEISDDEARTITVQQILLKTYYLDNNGNKVDYSEEEKQNVYKRAKEVLQKAKSGDTFATLISEYSDDETGTYSFGKGTYDPVFEKAAFELGTDEISDIVETDYGYHIIKCISTFNKEETDLNKLRIIEERKKEVFDEQYTEFVSTLNRNLNEELWNKINFTQQENVTTASFFDIYNEFFPAQI